MKEVEFDISKGFPLDIDLKYAASLIGGELIGENLPLHYLTALKNPSLGRTNFLTYATTPSYLESFYGSYQEAALVNRDIFSSGIENSKSVILVDGSAEDAFFMLHQALSREKIYPRLISHRGSRTNIHPSAVIYDNVYIGDDVTIEANAVLYSNTVVDKGARIKAGSVIGGEGIEERTIKGRKVLIDHIGGTYIGKNVTIGSLNTIDRHVIGHYTIIGAGTTTENLVHIAHGAFIDEDCSISSNTEISGSAVFGKGVWYGPNSCCSHQVHIGDYAFIAIGSIIIKDIPAFAYMLGNPPRQIAWICKCHKHKLMFEDDKAVCACGREYRLQDENVFLTKDTGS